MWPCMLTMTMYADYTQIPSEFGAFFGCSQHTWTLVQGAMYADYTQERAVFNQCVISERSPWLQEAIAP